MRIAEADDADATLKRQMAQLLADAFREHWANAWRTVEEAQADVEKMLAPDRICLLALDEERLLGMVGGLPDYGGRVWELHPMAVRPEAQGRGIGRALIAEFEARVRAHGGLTITLGSDDEDNMTSLSQCDLYENLWDKIKTIQNYKRHPFEFYQKMGYVITGVVPNANGIGKPDILMAKDVS
ncbi:MAG: GNAT family N-acetyltransferase [Anaerolineales bacterium]|nr:GNAT family N-acetyltransferase [Anaerolineales bacterium]